MRGLLALLLLWTAACGGAPTRPSPTVSAQALMRHVPQDAPYWMIYVGSDADHAYEDQLARVAPAFQDILEVRGPEPQTPGPERALWTLAARLDGKLNAAGLAELGLDRYLRLALYPVADVFPAVRLGLKDAARFGKLVEAVAQTGGAKPVEFPGGRYWRLDAPDELASILFVLDADSFAMAAVLSSAADAALDELTGKSPPASPLTIETLAAVAKPHDLIPLQAGRVLPEAFLDAPVLEPALEALDPACIKSLRYALSRTPRLVFGSLRPEKGQSQSYLYLIELAESSRKWWRGIVRPAPGVAARPEGAEAYLTVGVSEDGLRAAAVEFGQAWVESPSACPQLSQLNLFAPMLASGAVPPPDYQFGGVTGASVALRPGSFANPPIDMVLYSESSTTLRDVLGEHLAPLKGLAPTGEPVRAEEGFVIHAPGLVGFGTATAESLAALAKPARETGPFLWFWMSAAFAAHVQAEDLAEVENPALWERLTNLNAVLARNDISFTVALTELGFEMRVASYPPE